MLTAKTKFDLGVCVATRGAIDAMNKHGVHPTPILQRHALGDWGECCDDDKAANERALHDKSRLFSVYPCGDARLWIITDAEDDEGTRAHTTIMLPEEY